MKLIYTQEHKNLVNKLIEARRLSGMTQLQAAAKLNKSQSYLSKLESGQINVDAIGLKILAKIYNKTVNFFLD